MDYDLIEKNSASRNRKERLSDLLTDAYKDGFNDGRLVGTNDERDFLLSEIKYKIDHLPMYPSFEGSILKLSDINTILKEMERKK